MDPLEWRAPLGLDIYVGTLTRYYIGDWDAAVAPGGRSPAEETMLVRIGDNGHETPDPVEVREDILQWREWMNQEVDLLDGVLDWPEERDVPYYTDKPTWQAWGALQLWAAYEEHRGLERPASMPEAWVDDPAYQASQDEEFESRYPHLLFGVQVWLPVRMEGVFDAPDAYGDDFRYGSVPELLEELEELNARTWRADDAALRTWREAGPDRDGGLEALARFGLAVTLPLARRAMEFGLPMLLDE